MKFVLELSIQKGIGNTKNENVIIRLDFKTIQYDLKGVSARTTRAKEKTIYLLTFNQN